MGSLTVGVIGQITVMGFAHTKGPYIIENIFSPNWPLCSANTASEANVPSISRPAVNETILVHDFPHQAPRTSRPNDHPTPGKMPKKQTGHRKKSDTNGSSAHDEHKVKNTKFWSRAPFLRSLEAWKIFDWLHLCKVLPVYEVSYGVGCPNFGLK